MSIGPKCMRRPFFVCLLAALPLTGCHTYERRDYSQKHSDDVAAALATSPMGRDLDREGLQLTRTIGSLSDHVIRIYENRDGQFVVDEKHTLPDAHTVVEYLSGQERKHLRYGVVYLLSRGRISNEQGFWEIKTFCIQQNVDLYIADSPNIQNIWTQGRPKKWDNSSAGEAAWIVQARP